MEESGGSSCSSFSGKNPITVSKLKVAGAYSGVLEAELEVWTVPMLREQIAHRVNCEPMFINLICGGKVLKDGDENQKLSEVGIKNNAKILATRVSSVDHQMVAEEERSLRLDRIKAAADALAKRHVDRSLPVENFNIELEDQHGKKVDLGPETNQQAVMMGLMLHANARHLIKHEKYKDALDVLKMGEEAFSLCDPKLIERVDNVSILQIDTVWCYFMLRDITLISMAGVRLTKARDGLARSYKKAQQDRYPEISLYMKLELLEGVVAYHSGKFEMSNRALDSAQARFMQLQVPDEALALLMSMGYKEQQSKKALRINNQDVERAVAFLVEEREKSAWRREEDIRRRKEIKEQRRYGTTPQKKAVDLQRLNELESIGFEREVAAEALRRNENDTQKALDDLTNSEKNSDIQFYIDSRKRKRQRQKANAAIEELISMGFERSKVDAAVRMVGTLEKALQLLTSESMPETPITADDANSPAIASSSSSIGNVNSGLLNNEVDAPEDPLEVEKSEDRDVEMEDEIAKDLSGDPYSDYDIDITKEGEAIAEYLALLASAQNN